MSKALLSSSVLTVGAGLGLGVSAIGGARNSQSTLTKTKKDSIPSKVTEETPKAAEVNTSSGARVCSVYAVQNSRSKTVKLVDDNFLTQNLKDGEKSKIDSSCSEFGKAYIWNGGGSKNWLFSSDKDKYSSWTVVT
ncbi:hypothetical protein MHC_02850 [Mycoplasma haemocanis str. Illinois]|uniref:Uncharacterized protein n=1 Tax=Mycoplasma haemocanis (strain Illinois) TaxID=1111676 RepID=H6N710_MYCHN|nr:hypothetical protein [Mycoplasma haemocanis]AEW45432.1 hypothetical protein MHC_02850 [Mycoplasma haemocanis str. Illinois]